MLPTSKFLITAGPTREAIDPVRYITNHSSGKMGYAIAEAALKNGSQVTLVSGPVNLVPPENAKLVRIETTQELSEAVLQEFEAADCLIMAAAPADFRPKSYSDSKIKKSGAGLTIELEPTPDILRQVASLRRPGQVVVGFALETDNVIENAKRKLAQKQLDLIVVNSPTDQTGFNSETNCVTLIDQLGRVEEWELMPKAELAERLIQFVMKMNRQ
ncbi:MAG: phosphopantothenoylcysteine decarboxylase [bacterium]|nr:phosphopantothenoylcysteine decarboxylase [bacterium]